jgi:hypothetical protein
MACIDCYNYIVTNDDGAPSGGNYTYVDCNGVEFGPFNLGPGDNSGEFCAQEGSIVIDSGLTDEQFGSCGTYCDETPTPTPTQTVTSSNTPTQTPTITPTQTQTSTNTPTQTPTSTQTQTPTQTITPSNTPTQTQTPSSTTAGSGIIVQFQDCDNGDFIFRFGGPTMQSLLVGSTYLITGETTDFRGCATVINNAGLGPIYDSDNVEFIEMGGCSNPTCPRTNKVAAQVAKCSDGTIIYVLVDSDVSFPGATYVYNGECYQFIEFSGPGGDYIGSPQYLSCEFCNIPPTPSITPTNTPTPTKTPTPTPTPIPCEFDDYCFETTIPSLTGYNGNYVVSGTQNGKPFYSSNSGVIYYNGSNWCLSDVLNGECLLEGSECDSICPDISYNNFKPGLCPTPTPTPQECSDFDFNAYFDCDWMPVPTPTIIDCDDTSIVATSVQVVPTPTPQPNLCENVGVDFNITSQTLFSIQNNDLSLFSANFDVEVTDLVVNNGDIGISGVATFTMMEERFNCTSVKVLVDCNTSDNYYVNEDLIYNQIPLVVGTTFSAEINGSIKCVTYTENNSNISSNSYIGQINNIYADCGSCQ